MSVNLMKLSLLCSLFITNVFATNLNLKNVSLNYVDPNGSGKATLLDVDGDQHSGAFAVEKVADKVFLNFSGTRVEYEALSGLIKDAAETQVNNLNLSIGGKNISASADSFKIVTPSGSTSISGVSANCSGAAGLASNFFLSLLAQCSSNGSLRVSSLENISTTKMMGDFSTDDLANALIGEFLSHPEVNVYSPYGQLKGGGAKISNVNLNVKNGNFTGSVEVSVGINAKVDFEGSMKLIDNDKKLQIKVDKANVWIISVKDKLFTELQKISGLDVKNPYITITLSN